MQARSAERSLFPRQVQAAPNVAWGKSIPKTVRWSFLLFIFSIPLSAVPVMENVSLSRLSGLIFFACYFFHLAVPLKKTLPPIPSALLVFFVYYLIFAFTGFFIDEEYLREHIVSLLTLGQLIALLWLASDLFRSEQLTRRALLTFVAACVVLAVGTLLGVPGFTDLKDNRVATLGLSPASIAALVTYAALILIGFFLNERGWSRKRKYSSLALTIPLLSLLVSSGTRAGMGAFMVGVSLFVYRGNLRQKLAAIALGVVGVGAVVYFSLNDPVSSARWEKTITEGDVSGRGEIYAAALELIAERPLLGWGGVMADRELGRRKTGVYGGGRQDAHNIVLHLIIQVGLVGTIPFLIALWLCFRAAWRARAGRFGILPMALLTTQLVTNMAVTGMRAKELWLFLGLALALAATAKRVRARMIPRRSKVRVAERGLSHIER